MEDNILINSIINKENILIYINRKEDLMKLREKLIKYCKNHDINYDTRNYTALKYHRSKKPTIYYTYIPYKPFTNLMLLNTFVEKPIDKVFMMTNNEKLIHILG